MIFPTIVDTEVNDTAISQSMNRFHKSVYETQERQLKQALINMGWTPPQDRMNFLQKVLFKIIARISTNG